MRKKTRTLTTLRLRKEVLRILTTEQLTRVQGAGGGGGPAQGGTAPGSVDNDPSTDVPDGWE